MSLYRVEDVIALAERHKYPIVKRSKSNHCYAIIFGEQGGIEKEQEVQFEVISSITPAVLVHWLYGSDSELAAQSKTFFKRVSNDRKLEFRRAALSDACLADYLRDPPEKLAFHLETASRENQRRIVEDFHFARTIDSAVDYAVKTRERFYLPIVAVLPSRSLGPNNFLFETLVPSIYPDTQRLSQSTGFVAIDQTGRVAKKVSPACRNLQLPR